MTGHMLCAMEKIDSTITERLKEQEDNCMEDFRKLKVRHDTLEHSLGAVKEGEGGG